MDELIKVISKDIKRLFKRIIAKKPKSKTVTFFNEGETKPNLKGTGMEYDNRLWNTVYNPGLSATMSFYDFGVQKKIKTHRVSKKNNNIDKSLKTANYK